MSTAAERKQIRDLGVSARERILRANAYVERRGDDWYVDRESRNWAGSLVGKKRDLNLEEWRRVSDRLTLAILDLEEARDRVAIQIEDLS